MKNISAIYKRCSTCGKEYPRALIDRYFHKHPYTPDKHQSVCKDCAKKRATEAHRRRRNK